MQPLTFWSHWAGPNPMKIAIVLAALDIPHKVKILEFSEVKNEEYLKLNPNGRLPTIEDPNTGLTLWETAAIIQYLVEQYDKEGKISFKTFEERYLAQQWLAFQVSGQGPYFGQATWFTRFHAEKIPSAIDRYVDEIFRITGVLELGLKRNGTGWLVGDKCSYADLSFVTWAAVAHGVLKELGKYEELQSKYPLYILWLDALDKRDDVKKVKEQMARERAAHGLPP